jgi:hypothetical protein
MLILLNDHGCFMGIGPTDAEFLRGDHPDVGFMDDGQGPDECPLAATSPELTACTDVVIGQGDAGSMDTALPTIVTAAAVNDLCAPPVGTSGALVCSEWHFFIEVASLSPPTIILGGHSKSGVVPGWGTLCLGASPTFTQTDPLNGCE